MEGAAATAMEFVRTDSGVGSSLMVFCSSYQFRVDPVNASQSHCWSSRHDPGL